MPVDEVKGLKKRKINSFTLEEHDTEEIKRICIKHLPFLDGFTLDQLDIEVLSNSIINKSYKITSKCFNGNKSWSISLSVKRNLLNQLVSADDLKYTLSKLLGENNCGPRILGRFGEYTIQEWIEGKTLTQESFQNLSVITGLASSLAKFHKKSSTLAPEEWDKTPLILSKFDLWLENAGRIIKRFNLNLDLNELMTNAKLYKKVMDNHLKSSNSPSNMVLLCHNDLFSNNLLDTQHGIYLIDFDFAWFNYVGCEISSFFNRFYLIYDKNLKCFKSHNVPYIKSEFKTLFVSVYLSQLLDRNVFPEDKLVEEFLKSVEVHSLGVYLYWALWCLVMYVYFKKQKCIGWTNLENQLLFQDST